MSINNITFKKMNSYTFNKQIILVIIGLFFSWKSFSNDLTPPSNDEPNNAIALTVYPVDSSGGHEINGTLYGATETTSLPRPSCYPYNYSLKDVFYTFVAPSNGRIRIKLSSTEGITIYDASNNNEIICNYRILNQWFSGFTPNHTYLIKVWSHYASNFTIALEEVPDGPANDVCSGAISIPVNNYQEGNYVAQDLTLAESELPAPACTPYHGADRPHDVYFSFVAPNNGKIIIRPSNASVYFAAEILDSCNGNTVVCRKINHKMLIDNLTPGNTYILRIYRIDDMSNYVNFRLERTMPNASCSSPTALTIFPWNQNTTDYTFVEFLVASQSNMPLPACDTSSTHKDIFFTFSAPQSGRVLIYQQGVTFKYAVYESCSSAPVVCEENSTDSPLIQNLNPGQDYILRLWVDNTNNPNYANNNYDANILLYEFPQPPDNDDCANATMLTVYSYNESQNHRTQGTLVGATQSNIPGPSCDTQQGNIYDVFYKFVTPPTGNVRIYGTTPFAVYTSCNGTAIKCGDFYYTYLHYLNPGDTLLIRVYTHYLQNANTFSISVEELPESPANDFCNNAQNLTVYPAGQSVGHETQCSFISATLSSNMQASCLPSYGNYKDLFYSFSAPPSGEVFVRTNNGYFSLNKAIYNSCGGQEILCTDSNFLTGLTPGNNYILRLFTSNDFQDTLHIGLEAVPLNNHCSHPVHLTVYPYGQGYSHRVNVNTVVATGSTPRPSCIDRDLPDLYYSFTAPANGTVRMISNMFYMYGVIYDSCNGNEIQCVGYNTINTFTNLTPNHDYILRVLSYFETEYATLYLQAGQDPPINDDCSAAISLQVYPADSASNHYIHTSTISATQSSMSLPSCDTTGNISDIFYKFTAPFSGGIRIVTQPAQGNLHVKSAIYDSCNGTEIACFQPNHINSYTGLIPGHDYLLRLWTDQGEQQDFDLALEVGPPANDDCSNAFPLTVYPHGNGSGHETSFALYATPSGMMPSCVSNQVNDIFYTFTAPPSGSVDILNYTYSEINFAVYDSCNGNCLHCFTDNANLRRFGGLIPGNTYLLQVWINGSIYTTSTYHFVLEESDTPVQNDECSNPIPLTVYPNNQGGNNYTEFSLSHASQSALGNPGCTNDDTNVIDVFYSFVAPPSGTVILKEGPANIGHLNAVLYDACQGNELYCYFNQNQQHTFFNLTPGNTYILRLWGYDLYPNRTYQFLLESDLATSGNDDCNNSENITVSPSIGSVLPEIYGSFAYATQGHMPTDSSTTEQFYDLYYNFTPPSNKIFYFTRGTVGTNSHAMFYDSCNPSTTLDDIYYYCRKIENISANNNYILRKTQDGSDREDFKFSLTEIDTTATNNSCASAMHIDSIPFYHTTYFRSSSFAGNPCLDNVSGKWYSYTTGNSNEYVQLSFASRFSPYYPVKIIQVLSGDCGNLTCEETININNNDGSDYPQQYIYKTIELAANKTYYFNVLGPENTNDPNDLPEGIFMITPATNFATPVIHKLNLIIFPNPTEDKLTIKAPAKILKIHIADINGVNLFEKDSNKKSEVLDLTDLPKGVYLISVTLENGDMGTYKIVKE